MLVEVAEAAVTVAVAEIPGAVQPALPHPASVGAYALAERFPAADDE